VKCERVCSPGTARSRSIIRARAFLLGRKARSEITWLFRDGRCREIGNVKSVRPVTTGESEKRRVVCFSNAQPRINEVGTNLPCAAATAKTMSLTFMKRNRKRRSRIAFANDFVLGSALTEPSRRPSPKGSASRGSDVTYCRISMRI